MRAPLQVLALPYRWTDSDLEFCIFLRRRHDTWQFISGGGEDDETPLETVKREVEEESGIIVDSFIPLKSMCYIRSAIFPEEYRDNWPKDMYVIPEYAFGFECSGQIRISAEHRECRWVSYDEAMDLLKHQSNNTAMSELKCRLEGE